MKWTCPFCGSENETKDYRCEVCGKKFRVSGGKLVEVKTRPPEYLISIFLILAFLLFNAALIGIEYASDPRLCTTCHQMEYYFHSWEESTHKGVKCYVCHYGTNPVDFIRGAYHSLSVLSEKPQVYRNLPANVSSDNCLACHGNITNVGYLNYKNLSFSHSNHLNGYKRGFLHLECVSCHREIVIGSHIAVKDTTCFVCHFYKTPEGLPITGCPSCHKSPSDNIELGNISFSHSLHLEKDIKCEFCHKEIIKFSGNMSLNCKQCHGDDDVLTKQLSDLEIHSVHVNSYKLDCVTCHETPEHKPKVDFEKCSLCHRGMNIRFQGPAVVNGNAVKLNGTLNETPYDVPISSP
ncbi:cytochrome c3 family protein [Geoglobus acetivorans]|uniref:Cytochrome c family protein n=1 Tax=Geoglobus acetivorans TaxID=565033 RepID=A0A0A7GHG2_GEOAI|nr:Cytochrome c family protein [Geoglobus acetivorans]